LFRKPPIFYVVFFVLGFILGEVLSSYLPSILPKSGALELATQKFQFGLESLKIDLIFAVFQFGLKIKASVLGILSALAFVVIGRHL